MCVLASQVVANVPPPVRFDKEMLCGKGCPRVIGPQMTFAPSAPSASQYLPPLTGIRALAAMLVLGLHTEQNVPVGLQSVLPFFARGYLGVDFFFVLSGFIITHVYLASLASASRRMVKIFLWHRFIRLYPVHATVLAGLVAVVGLAAATGTTLNNPQEWRWNELFWQLTLLHAWGVTASPGWNAPSWSISAEWFAYLLFPLLAPMLLRVRACATALLIAVAALSATAALFAIDDWTLNTWVGAPALTRVCGEFLCGAALCRAVALSPGSMRSASDVLGAGAFVAFLVGASAGLTDFALVALLAATVWGAATSGGPLARCLGSRVLVWLGEISYSIYMVHFPVLIVIRRVWERAGFPGWNGAAKTSAFLGTVALVIALAALLFYVVERPARTRLRDRMGKLTPT
jgi:peptidoglycan/LPS O-acetylase OafA/YrhL